MQRTVLFIKTFITGSLIFFLTACGSEPAATPVLVITPTPTVEPSPVFPPETIPLIGDYPILSPDEMRSDLDELFYRLETNHPNLYAIRPKLEVAADRQRVVDNLTSPLTVIFYYKMVSPLISSLGDLHTSVYLPNETMSEIFQKELFIPVEIFIQDNRAFVLKNLSENPTLAPGSEVLSINGVPVSQVMQVTEQFDQVPFGFSLWLVFGSLTEYRFEVLQPNETVPVVLTTRGLTISELNDVGMGDYYPLTYVSYPGEKIGLLTINDFVDINQSLKSAFTQIRDDGIEHLVIDIRANGGGMYEQVDSVMRYLTDQPYRKCASYMLAPPAGQPSTASRNVDCETIAPNETPLRYQGNIYLLIGPDTLSGAITFATILQDYRLATLIGQESGDFASYCAFVSEPFPLPRTSLLYRCSTRCFIRPGGVSDTQPVIPDVFVPINLVDRLSGTDPVLDRTLEMIRNNP